MNQNLLNIIILRRTRRIFHHFILYLFGCVPSSILFFINDYSYGFYQSLHIKFNFDHYNIDLIMIKLLSTQVLCARFAMNNKTQNFFDMNPIYPYMGEKNFDIYNSERKKINVIDQYLKMQGRDVKARRIVYNHLFAPKYVRYRRYTGGTKIKIDPSTKLGIGLDSDFDDFVSIFRVEFLSDKNAKSQFKQTLLKLIKKFKCKSEPELIKLFRISLANGNKKSLLQKLRGSIISEAVLKAAELNKSQIINQNTSQQEQEVEKSLRELDKKIEQAQQAVRYDFRGVPKTLSRYDSKYGWMQQTNEPTQQDYDVNIQKHFPATVRVSSDYGSANLHDQSIKSRINRLYFLRRLEYLRGGAKQYSKEQLQKQIPLHLRNREKIMNQLAFKYKETEAMQIPDLQQIYQEIDVAIDKVYVDISTSEKNQTAKKNLKSQIFDKNFDQHEYLWNNINAEEILCESLYTVDSKKDVILTEDQALKVSPSTHTELALNKIPINLFRHTELDVIGAFNEYRKKLGQNLMNVQQMDFQPYFEQYSLQSVRKTYLKPERKTSGQATKAVGRARRKTAYAIAVLKRGTGVVTINGQPLQDYFGDTYYRVEALKPLVFTDSSGYYDVKLQVMGSGSKGQAECMAYAIARALIKINPEHESILYNFGLVGHDSRKKEAKKTNLYSARVRPPYVRR